MSEVGDDIIRFNILYYYIYKCSQFSDYLFICTVHEIVEFQNVRIFREIGFYIFWSCVVYSTSKEVHALSSSVYRAVESVTF